MRFTLAALEEAGLWDVKCWNACPVLAWADVLPAGEHEREMPFGTYFLRARSPSGAQAKLGPFEVAENGVDLGLIDAVQLQSISGTVTDADGNGWDGVRVSAWLDGGTRYGIASTSAQGDFTIDGLGAGAYTLEVVTYNSHLLRGPDFRRRVRLPVGENLEGLSFVVPSDGFLRARLTPPPTAPWTGWSVSGSLLQVCPVDPTGTFEVAPTVGPAPWVGGSAFDPAGLRVAARQPDENTPPTMLVPRDQGQKHRVRFLDLSGDPASFRLVRVEVAGALLPSATATDADGWFEAEIGAGAPVVLLTESADGHPVRIPAATLPASGNYTLGGGALTSNVQVLDVEGEPVNAVSILAMNDRVSAISLADGSAVLNLTRTGTPLWIEKPGYWPVRAPAGGQVQAVLRRMGCELRVEAAEGLRVERVKLEPRFISGFAWEPVLVPDGREEHRWTAEDLPEGEYVLFAFDPATQIVARETVRLKPAAPAEVHLR